MIILTFLVSCCQSAARWQGDRLPSRYATQPKLCQLVNEQLCYCFDCEGRAWQGIMHAFYPSSIWKEGLLHSSMYDAIGFNLATPDSFVAENPPSSLVEAVSRAVSMSC